MKMSHPSKHYDCLVIGAGLAGAQSAAAIAARGLKVALVEQYAEGPSQGASFGETRIVRPVEWEVDAYAPMVQRSIEIFKQLNAECEKRGLPPVFYETGGLYGGPVGSDIFEGARACAERHSIRHEILDARQVREKFPALNIPDHYKLVHDFDSGILVPERVLELHYTLARERAADLHFGTEVKTVESLDERSLLVTTNKGAFTTKKLVVAAGAWSGRLLEKMGLPSVIENSSPELGYVAWIEPPGDDTAYRAENLPVITIGEDHKENVYGFPVMKGPGMEGFTPGIKLGATMLDNRRFYDPDPQLLRFSATEAEARENEARARYYSEKFFPGTVNQPIAKGAHCVWTDNDSDSTAMFLGPHPGDKRIVIACGDNGEGARLSGAVSEAVADLITDKNPRFDLSPFALDRPEVQKRCFTRHTTLPYEMAALEEPEPHYY